MNVIFLPQGGRWGYGFNYWCSKCGTYLGNSLEDKHLQHISNEKVGNWYNRKTVPSKCAHAGETFDIPVHVVSVTKIDTTH